MRTIAMLVETERESKTTLDKNLDERYYCI